MFTLRVGILGLSMAATVAAGILASFWPDADAGDFAVHVVFPKDFRSSMAHYATVDRPDGKVYDLFINGAGLESWRRERRLASGSLFVIESFNARKDPQGELLRDADGRLLKSTSDNEIHVTEKRATWARENACESPSLMRGEAFGPETWRVGAFDPRDGHPVEVPSQPIWKCHQCHQEQRAEDFILSRGLLDAFIRSGTVSQFFANCNEREVCFGSPPPQTAISSPHPAQSNCSPGDVQ